MDKKEKHDEQEPTYQESRLSMGEAYMMCQDCGARLYSFDGDEDAARPCPGRKNGKCEL